MTNAEKLEAAREWIRRNVLSTPETIDYLGLGVHGFYTARHNGELKPVLRGFYLKPDLDRYKVEM